MARRNPLLALALLIEPGVLSTTLLIATTSWMNVARVVEAQIRPLRERDFAVAIKAMGSTNMHTMFRSLLPNAMARVIVDILPIFLPVRVSIAPC